MMSRLLLFLGVLLTILNTQAQVPTLSLSGKLPTAQMELGPYTAFYEDRLDEPLPLVDILQQVFQPFLEKKNERTHMPDRSRRVIWLRFTLRNTHASDTLRLFHDTGAHCDITTYENGRLLNRAGISISAGLQTEGPLRRPFRFETLLTIPPQAERTYYVRVVDYVVSVTPVWSVASTVQASLKHNYEGSIFVNPLLLVMSLLLGGLLFMCFYALYSFLLSRDTTFLYYVLYTGTSALMCFHNIDMRFGLGIGYPHYLTLHPYYPAYLHPALITIFYSLFIARMVGLRWHFSLRTAPVVVLFGVLLAQQGLSVAEAFGGEPFFRDNTVYRFAMVPSGIATLVLLGLVLRNRSPLRSYLMVGILFVFTLTMVSVLFHLWFTLSPGVELFVDLVSFWMQVGLSVEAFCFMLALAYRGRLIELENRQMQERYARDLEIQLAQRTTEIEQQSRQLEAQHFRQLELGFEQKLAETEMTALRAQMNPHFIFNCLNSIKLYATENDSTKAAKYLTKFSRLIRLVLENSRSERVTLQNELDALRLYLDMETMRFKNKLRFDIQVAPEVDADFTEIPPLLIQPYVENAIWHGLMHKPEGGRVTVDVSQPTENLLHVEITDDGIGRQRATELKSKSAGKHKSFGMKVTADRIRMINQLYSVQTQVQIYDLIDSFGEACGTRVILEIPV